MTTNSRQALLLHPPLQKTLIAAFSPQKTLPDAPALVGASLTVQRFHYKGERLFCQWKAFRIMMVFVQGERK